MASNNAGESGLTINLVTPQGPIAQEESDAVLAPGRMGQFEILEGHVPFLSELHAGVLVFGENAKKSFFAVGPGFLEVEPGGVVQVLCEQACAVADINLEEAKAELKELETQMNDWKDSLDAEYRSIKSRLDWAQAQVDTVELSSSN